MIEQMLDKDIWIPSWLLSKYIVTKSTASCKSLGLMGHLPLNVLGAYFILDRIRPWITHSMYSKFRYSNERSLDATHVFASTLWEFKKATNDINYPKNW